jgi:tetratricopeptide (TPR) repeat protein
MDAPKELLHGGTLMSRTLNLVDRLLALGRNYQQVGRNQEALHVLHSLARFQELPAAVAEETQARLAEIQLHRCRYRRARRHLRAALRFQPESARYHWLLAGALVADEKGDLQRAAEHYRKSLAIDPKQPCCLRDFGLLALRLEQTEEGLQALARAVELAPADPELLASHVDGLCQANRPEEARRMLQAALFRNPKDRRFHQLWSDFQFRQLSTAQQTARQEASDLAEGGASMLLPFVRPTECASLGGKRLRRDAAAPPSPPHTARPDPVHRQRRAR